jgi:hypothetical protein
MVVFAAAFDCAGGDGVVEVATKIADCCIWIHVAAALSGGAEYGVYVLTREMGCDLVGTTYGDIRKRFDKVCSTWAAKRRLRGSV